jgi:predicted regulator of Ras-like GTPase activity (Roadblock/LC7/MglB family)
MRKILLINDDLKLLSTFPAKLKQVFTNLEIFVVSEGKLALEILKNHAISLVFSQLKVPADGFDIFAHLNKDYPHVSLVIINNFTSKNLLNAIKDLLIFLYSKNETEALLNDFSLLSIFQLLEVEKQTATLAITTAEQVGIAFFKDGVLKKAQTNANVGNQAIYEMVAWRNPEIIISKKEIIESGLNPKESDDEIPPAANENQEEITSDSESLADLPQLSDQDSVSSADDLEDLPATDEKEIFRSTEDQAAEMENSPQDDVLISEPGKDPENEEDELKDPFDGLIAEETDPALLPFLADQPEDDIFIQEKPKEPASVSENTDSLPQTEDDGAAIQPDTVAAANIVETDDKEENNLFSIEKDLLPALDENEFIEEAAKEPDPVPPKKSGKWGRRKEDAKAEAQSQADKFSEILSQLSAASGFIGAGIYDAQGEILASKANDNVDFFEIGGLAIELYHATNKIADKMKIGTCSFIEIHSAENIFIHACIIPGKEALGVLMNASANIGLTKHQIKRIMPALLEEFS